MSRAVRWIAWAIATWFGCGRAPLAPGTAGTLGAVPLYLLVARWGPTGVALAAVALSGIGVWAAGLVAREIGAKDPPAVVVDEVVGFLFTMAPVRHAAWGAVAVGFLLFRVLDVTKPWPIRRLEALPRGWGIVADDAAAGLIGAGAMALAQRVGLLP
jgi:phosphatidylglycerophosphatase A